MSDKKEEGLNLEVKECTQEEGTRETHRTLSWIWQTTSINIEDGTDNNEEILHVEWCKSWAQAKRSLEEVLLLREEMCCILKFLSWKAEWWEER